MLFDGWMKEQIIYKHVKRRLPGNTGRNTPGFYSSCNRSQRNRGPYKTQRAAALASCQYLDIPLSKRKRSKNMEKCPSQSFTSQYRYVYYNKVEGSGLASMAGLRIVLFPNPIALSMMRP